MKFSELATKKLPKKRDWFDPILSSDSAFFLDPFLIYSQEFGVFNNSHELIIKFFNIQFKRIAASGGKKTSTHYLKALDDLFLPEVAELCLGYTVLGISGSGSGKKTANAIAAAMREAIDAGLTELTHFEEVSMFRDSFGADRISDSVANLLRPQLCAYTSNVCRALGIPSEPFHFPRGQYDFSQAKWIPLHTKLPVNTWSKRRRAIIIAPKIFLRTLPSINSDDFWDYCYINDNAFVRRQFGSDISQNVDKPTIVKLAREFPKLVKQYVKHVEKSEPEPYAFDDDPEGVLTWYLPTISYLKSQKQTYSPKNQTELVESVDGMVASFKHFMEHKNGTRLLRHDDGNPRRESNAQRAFHLSIIKTCRDCGIDVNPEAQVGRGPVDFKFSVGNKKLLLEIKYVRSTQFWHGLTTQLPIYLQGDLVQDGIYLAITFNDDDIKKSKEIQKTVRDRNRKHNLRMKFVLIDARLKPSASVA